MRRMMQATALALGLCAAAAVDGAVRAESVDLELVLLADASGSLDDAEIHYAMLAGTAVAPPQLDEFFLRQDAPLRAADLRALGFTET